MPARTPRNPCSWSPWISPRCPWTSSASCWRGSRRWWNWCSWRTLWLSARTVWGSWRSRGSAIGQGTLLWCGLFGAGILWPHLHQLGSKTPVHTHLGWSWESSRGVLCYGYWSRTSCSWARNGGTSWIFHLGNASGWRSRASIIRRGRSERSHCLRRSRVWWWRSCACTAFGCL